MLGPADGRYVLRGHAGEPEHVLVLETVGAPPKRRRRGLLGPKLTGARVPAQPPLTPVPVTVATIVGAVPFAGADEAAAWLERADLAAEAHAAAAVLNGVLHAQRIASADPLVHEVVPEQAIAIRIGIGLGDEVAQGQWTDARTLAPWHAGAGGGAPRRERALAPQERFAALLAGRDVALAAELLTLRARLDLDRGRTREAALQVRVALEAALSELQAWAHHAELARRLDELRDERAAVAAAANRALQGGLDAAQIADVERVVARLEAALAARVAGGLE